MTTYIYSGPTSGLTLRGEKGAKKEVMLFAGKHVDLPDCNEVKTLVALKRLTPVAASAASAAAPAPTMQASEPAASESAQAEADTPAVAATTKKGA